jgi:phosphopantothenoylcysteine decarboxylase/phosphopantothenate--cysteine ligase
VADFKPAQAREHKVKRSQGIPNFQLQPTVDILEAIRQERRKSGHPRLVVGFAAESDNLIANAQKKLANKELDMIAANDISAADAGFDVDTNRVTLLHKDGEIEELPLMSKADVATEIIERIISLIAKGG